MAYFLKKSKNKKGLYLQIYFSYRDPQIKQPRNKSHKAIGYYDDLVKRGIADPIAYCQAEVDALNVEFRTQKRAQKAKTIGKLSPVMNLGYFAAASILNKLNVKDDMETLGITRQFRFSVYDCFRFLLFARLVDPASKSRTVSEVIPSLYGAPSFSYDQILECLDLYGNNYEKAVEIFTHKTHEAYILDTSKAFFDCTNFYFEIDREDAWRRKGPSKENRRDPILGMGLLLDANCIPIGMRLYPGNQSEKPVLREVINSLKRQQNITGRTVQVADKGLNCAQNIYEALSHKDGYIFSKSVKMLPEADRAKVLDKTDMVSIQDQETGDEHFRIKSFTGIYTYSFKTESGRKIDFRVKEKRIVTYNPSLARKQRNEINKMVDKARYCVLSHAKKSEYGESSKYINFNSIDEKGEVTDDKVITCINEAKVQKDLACAGFNMLVTSELDMDMVKIYDTYHELWRIEESFKTMKSQLDARPVYLQNADRIKGHFLICYVAVLIERLLQFKALENKFPSEQVYGFLREFQILPANGSETRAVNVSPASEVVRFLDKKYNLPLMNYYLTQGQIQKILERTL